MNPKPATKAPSSSRRLSHHPSQRLAPRKDGIAHIGERGKAALGRLPVAGAAGILDDNGHEAEIGAVRAVGSMPISMATPMVAKEVRPQSRRMVASGVSTKAEKVILSRMASSPRGASSGAISKPGEERRN